MVIRQQAIFLANDDQILLHHIDGLEQDWYLLCISNGDTTILHQAINIFTPGRNKLNNLKQHMLWTFWVSIFRTGRFTRSGIF